VSRVEQAYLRFLERTPPRDPDDSYLFSEPRVRFRPEPNDVLYARDVSVLETETGVELRTPNGASVAIPGMTPELARPVVDVLDGSRTLREIERAFPGQRRVLDGLLGAGFGIVIFAPIAVSELERELSGIEIVRFPGAPYEIVRGYWRNMIAVRKKLRDELESAPASPDETVELLKRLHVVTLTGNALGSFYEPASPSSRKGLVPGELWDKATETRSTPEGTLFVAGPRVNASLLGGRAYQELVCASAGDAGALADDRELVEDGLSWGRLVFGRTADEEEPKSFFCPPRPFTPEHVARLHACLIQALTLAQAGDRSGTLRALAQFHQRFVRLHPFKAANQSLCMNIVGYVLGLSHGAGMPHTILDHLALRLSEPAYERVFALAAEVGIVQGGAAERWRVLAERKRRSFDFIARLGRGADPRAALRADPESARFALVAAAT
jgi:hypothetical protein